MAEAKRTDGERLKESAERLLSDWLEFAKVGVDELEKFVREKPVAGAASAFVAGFVLGAVLKR
jgi:ElaB/YqjD/DUF883 family membrane-anchored ribosome-binding protein